MKKKESFSNPKKPLIASTSLKPKKSLESSQSLPTKSNKNESQLIQDLKFFEKLRTHLLQWHLLNCEINEKIKKQADKQELDFFLRYSRIFSMQNEHTQLEIEKNYKIVIKYLEEILAIEFPTIKEIYPKIDLFIAFSKNLDEYLSSSLKKIFLGEGISIDITFMNDLIKHTEFLFQEIFKKHDIFFKKYEDIKTQLRTIILNMKELFEDFQAYLSEIFTNEAALTDKIFEKNSSSQKNRIKNLESEFLV